MASFGELLREKRRIAGVSQRELAAEAGLDFSYIRKLENDRIPPPAADTVVGLCRILKIDPEEMLTAMRKVPPRIPSGVGSGQAGQTFLQHAERLRSTAREWQTQRSSLRV